MKRITRGWFLRQVGLIGAAGIAAFPERLEGGQMSERDKPDDDRQCPEFTRQETPEAGWRIQEQVLVTEDGAIRVMVGEAGEVLYAEANETGDGPLGAFSVFGSVALGDIYAVGIEPIDSCRRQTPTHIATPTNLYSNRNLSSDQYGGASINLYSDEEDSPERGSVDSGYVNVVAYGRGTGPKANSVRCLNRDGANSLALRMIVDSGGDVGIGTETPTERLDVDGELQIGSADAPGAIILYDEVDGTPYRVAVEDGEIALIPAEASPDGSER